RARTRSRGWLADRRAQRSARAAGRPGRCVRRRLAGRGPAVRPVERPGTARTRHADRVRPRPRRCGRAGRVGAAHGEAAGPWSGGMIATDEPGRNGLLVAGVDVGGTKTSVVVTDDRDRILYEHVLPTDPSSLVGQI